MVFKDCIFFSYVFLVTAIILLAGHAHGAGLCDNAPNKQVCNSIVNQRTDPLDATVAAVHKLVFQTKVGKKEAQKFDKSLGAVKCVNGFDTSIEKAKGALKSLAVGDLKNYFTTAQNIYLDCDKTFPVYGETNPITKTTKLLEDMASAGSYLLSLIK